MDALAWVERLSATPAPVRWLILGLAAWIEYVFPPFPGDSVVVVGAAVTAWAGEPLWPVWVAVSVGAVAGAACDWWLGTRAATRIDRLTPRQQRWVARLVEGFRRYGPALLVLNRFVPGVRAAFFVAAGVAGLPLGPVLAWSALSAWLWNGALILIGASVGWHLDTMLGAVWWALAAGAGVAALVAVAWWRQGRIA